VDMTKKLFFRVGLFGILAAWMIIVGSACSNDITTDIPLTEKSYYSTTVDGHSHSVTITKTEIENAQPILRTTSLVNSHTHIVSLSQEQVQSLKDGATVSVETTVDNGHSHTFSFQKWY
jgi:hypothetical protein